jgi:hypothetical protein
MDQPGIGSDEAFDFGTEFGKVGGEQSDASSRPCAEVN